MENAELILSNLNTSAELIDGGEENILSKISTLKSLISQTSKYGKEFELLLQRVNSVHVELKELSLDLSSS